MRLRVGGGLGKTQSVIASKSAIAFAHIAARPVTARINSNQESTMRCSFIAYAASAWVVGCVAAHAQAPVTATCNDGSSYSGKARSGACSHHGGVKAFDTAAPARFG